MVASYTHGHYDSSVILNGETWKPKKTSIFSGNIQYLISITQCILLNINNTFAGVNVVKKS